MRPKESGTPTDIGLVNPLGLGCALARFSRERVRGQVTLLISTIFDDDRVACVPMRCPRAPDYVTANENYSRCTAGADNGPVHWLAHR